MIAGAVFINGVFTLKRPVPTGANTVIGRIPTQDVPLQTTYFSLLIPDGHSYLASFSPEGDVVIYNYTGSEILVGWQLYPVGLAWVFK